MNDVEKLVTLVGKLGIRTPELIVEAMGEEKILSPQHVDKYLKRYCIHALKRQIILDAWCNYLGKDHFEVEVDEVSDKSD